LHQNHLYYAK